MASARETSSSACRMSACGSRLCASMTGVMYLRVMPVSAKTLPLSICSARSQKLSAAMNCLDPGTEELYTPTSQRMARSSASRLPGRVC